MTQESSSSDIVPAGFDEVAEGFGFADSLRPFYQKVLERQAIFGIVVERKHANTMNILHGGVIMTLADVVSARNIWMQLDPVRGTPTISINFNFVSAVKVGGWVEAHMTRVELKKNFAFTQGELLSEERCVASFNAVHRIAEQGSLQMDPAMRAKVEKLL